MGQPVAVVEKPSKTPGIIRYELNRNLTGMGHDRFASSGDAQGSTPSALLARRLFDTGKVAAVHVYGNIITVDLAKGQSADGLVPVFESLYTYYVPGFVPPPLAMPAEEATTSAAASPAGDGAAAGGAASRVPADLLEKSRLAKERWLANKAAG